MNQTAAARALDWRSEGTRVGHGGWQVVQGGERSGLMQDIRPKWRIDGFIIFAFSDDLIDI